MKKPLVLLLLVALTYSQCQAGQMLVDFKCAPVTYIQGCFLYAKNGTCDVCEYGYIKDCEGLCLPNNERRKQQCCVQRDQQGNCINCAPGLYLENVKCKRNIIDKCVAKLGPQCIACGKGFYLKENKCWPYIEGCEEYLNTGACSRCSFSVVKGATCDLKYELANGICRKRKSISNDYVNDSSKCQHRNSYGCINCQNGYYLNQNKECVLMDQGCLIYLRGKCKQCSSLKGYLLDQSTGQCLRKMKSTILNCIQYDQLSHILKCLNCGSGFRLIQNKCTQQTLLPKRIKKECAKGFILTSDYKCKSQGGNLLKKEEQVEPISVIVKQPGCIYQYNRCEYCEGYFVKVNDTCTIPNCMEFEKKKGKVSETYECIACRYPYQLNTQGICEVKNCAKYDNNRCSLCQVGYHLRAKQSCVFNDVNCKIYNDDGVCEKCSENYFVSSQGECMLKQSNCAEQYNTAKGLPICVACLDGFFLNRHNQCQKVDAHCQIYVNGFCKSCRVRYFLYDDICFPYSFGCVKYNGKDCTDCKKGFSLFKGQCYGLKSLSMKLQGQDDQYDFDIYPLDITKSKYYIDNLSPAKQICNIISSSIFSTEYSNPLLTFEDNYYANDNKRNLGWKAATNERGQYIGYKMMDGEDPVTFYALQIEAIEQSLIKSFYLEYTKDGTTWIRVDSKFLVEKYYKKGGDNSIVTIYFTGIYAKAIRIVIDDYVNWPACKIEFFYYDMLRYKKIINLKSLKYLRETIETNYIDRVDNQLYINQKYFFDPKFQCYTGGEMACFTGLELCELRNISKIELINDNQINGPSYISEFYLTTSNNGRKFDCYNQCKKYQISDKDLKLSANGNYRSILVNLPGLTAKNLRVYPTKWVGQPKLSIIFDYQ